MNFMKPAVHAQDDQHLKLLVAEQRIAVREHVVGARQHADSKSKKEMCIWYGFRGGVFFVLAGGPA